MAIVQKEIGAYFTPPKVARFIVEDTIKDYILNKIDEQFDCNCKSIEHFISRSDPQIIERVFSDFLKPIRVLDPAVGNGVFLLAAIDTLAAISYRLLKHLPPDPKTKGFFVAEYLDLVLSNPVKSIKALRQYFASHCVFGVDILPSLVEEARNAIKRSLWGHSDSKKKELATDILIDHNVVVGNSLIGFNRLFFEEESASFTIQKQFMELCKLSSHLRCTPTSTKALNCLSNAQNSLKELMDDHYYKLISTNLGAELPATLEPFHWFIHFPEIISSGGFDIIIGNPPFLDSKRWNYSAAAKASFEVNHGILHQAANADMFAYFLEIAIRLLKSDGFFGFIVSDKWLDVSFGVNLKRFLLDETYLRSIVMIDQGVFSKAAVDCVVILGKRKAHRQSEKEFVTRFVRVPKVANLASIENAKADSEVIQHITPSSCLSAEERWSIYLKAPKIYNEIISCPNLVPLDQIATINRGVTTGANQFFFLTREAIDSYNIPKDFIRPIVDSPRSLNALTIKKAPLYVLAIPRSCSLETLPEEVRFYIQEGEKRKYHQRRMVQARKPWYSLPLSKPAPLLAAKMMDKTPMFYLNPKAFFANNVFYEINPKIEQVQLIWLYLNSTVAHLLVELRGRSYHGGVLEIAAFELKRFPCLLPSELMPFFNEVRESDLFSGHMTPENRKAIDTAILDILGLKDRYKELQNAVSELQKYRLTKKERS